MLRPESAKTMLKLLTVATQKPAALRASRIAATEHKKGPRMDTNREPRMDANRILRKGAKANGIVKSDRGNPVRLISSSALPKDNRKLKLAGLIRTENPIVLDPLGGCRVQFWVTS